MRKKADFLRLQGRKWPKNGDFIKIRIELRCC